MLFSFALPLMQKTTTVWTGKYMDYFKLRSWRRFEGWRKENMMKAAKTNKPYRQTFIFFLKMLFLCFPSFLFTKHSKYNKKGAKTKCLVTAYYFFRATKSIYFENSYNLFLLRAGQFLQKIKRWFNI